MTTTRSLRLALAALLTATLALGSGAGLATAQRHGPSSITSRVDDPTPAVGEAFVVRGNYVFEGLPADAHTVKVQTYRNGHWTGIEGARVTTHVDGDYRVRVILFIRGVRDLRVVGVSGTADHPNSYDRFVVEVSRH